MVKQKLHKVRTLFCTLAEAVSPSSLLSHHPCLLFQACTSEFLGVLFWARTFEPAQVICGRKEPILHLLMPQSRGLFSPAADSHSSWPPISFSMSVSLVPPTPPTVTQTLLIWLWICLEKQTEVISVITNYLHDFCRRGTLMSSRTGAGKLRRFKIVVWLSLLGWDVEIYVH